MVDVIEALAAASRPWIGDSPTGAMQGAMRAFIAAATSDDALLRAAAATLGKHEPGSIAFIAVAFGSLVERGASAEITGPAVFEELRSWLPRLPKRGGDDARPVPTPEQAMLLARFQFLCQSAVTHLARLPARREALSQDRALLERLDELREFSYGAWWVHEALLKTSGTLVVLHPPGATGLRLRFNNVSSCFHLFSLIQTAVGTSIPGGRTPDETIARVARGKSSEAITDEAWWLYGSARSSTADESAAIAGESCVSEIPRVEGEPVLLLWPSVRQAPSWDSGLFGPHLEAMPADASVERMLTPDETRAWLEKLGVGRQRKRWWPF